jgi:hypothetical protein
VGGEVGLSLTLEDAYTEGEEIQIGVASGEGLPELVASLQDAISGVQITSLPVRRGGAKGLRVVFDPLPAGHYRLTIRGEEVSPIRDVFLVGEYSV